MNSIGYKIRKPKFLGEYQLRKIVSDIYANNFDVCEKEDGNLIVVWGKTTAPATSMDIYVCDGVSVDDVISADNFVETSQKTTKILTLDGDYTGVTKAFSVFNVGGTSYLVIKEAGRYNPQKAGVMRVYTKPSDGSSGWTNIYSKTMGIPSSSYGGGLGYAGNVVSGFSRNKTGTFFVPFAESTGITSTLHQLYSTDYGQTWNYKATYMDIPEINWGGIVLKGKYFQTLHTDNRFILTLQQQGIATDDFYAFESIDGIDWTEHHMTANAFNNNYTRMINFARCADYAYINIPFTNKMYRRIAWGIAATDFLDSLYYEEVETIGAVKSLNAVVYEMHYLKETDYLITSYTYKVNDITDGYIHFRW